MLVNTTRGPGGNHNKQTNKQTHNQIAFAWHLPEARKGYAITIFMDAEYTPVVATHKMLIKLLNLLISENSTFVRCFVGRGLSELSAVWRKYGFTLKWIVKT